MDTIQPLLTCMVHGVCVLWTHRNQEFCLFTIQPLCFHNADYRSCFSRLQILCFHNTDHRPCVSRMQILRFRNTDHRSCVSRMRISSSHDADIVYWAGMHHLRHVWRSFKAGMGKFFSSLVDLRQVCIFRHVGMHLKYILGQCLIRIWAKLTNKLVRNAKSVHIVLSRLVVSLKRRTLFLWTSCFCLWIRACSSRCRQHRDNPTEDEQPGYQ